MIAIIIALQFHFSKTDSNIALEVNFMAQVNDQLAEYTLEIESLKTRVKTLE